MEHYREDLAYFQEENWLIQFGDYKFQDIAMRYYDLYLTLIGQFVIKEIHRATELPSHSEMGKHSDIQFIYGGVYGSRYSGIFAAGGDYLRYFIVRENPKFQAAPRIKNWFGKIDVRNIKQGGYHKLPERLLLLIEESEKTVFTDVIVAPFFLVNEEIKECLKLYEPNLGFREMVLLDQKNKKAREHFLSGWIPLELYCGKVRCGRKYHTEREQRFYTGRSCLQVILCREKILHPFRTHLVCACGGLIQAATSGQEFEGGGSV